MGVDAGDYDGSGRPALWVTNYENELHALYRNDMQAGRAVLPLPDVEAGLAAIGQKYVGWGTASSTWTSTAGRTSSSPTATPSATLTGKGVGRKQPPVLFRNLGGKFKDISRQIGSYHDTNHLARGVGFGDLDNDGRTDLVISHINEPVAVLRGIGGQDCHWLGVQLRRQGPRRRGRGQGGAAGRRSGRLTRFAKGGGSYLSSGDRRLLFGLGQETKPGRLTVTWPDGGKQTFDGLAGDRYYRIRQGQAQAEPCPGGSRP